MQKSATSGSKPGGLFCADAIVAMLRVKTAKAVLNMDGSKCRSSAPIQIASFEPGSKARRLSPKAAAALPRTEQSFMASWYFSISRQPHCCHAGFEDRATTLCGDAGGGRWQVDQRGCLRTCCGQGMM